MSHVERNESIDKMFAGLEQLLADLEAGKPFCCSPELRALAEKVVADQKAQANAPPMTEEELKSWATMMAEMICMGALEDD